MCKQARNPLRSSPASRAQLSIALLLRRRLHFQLTLRCLLTLDSYAQLVIRKCFNDNIALLHSPSVSTRSFSLDSTHVSLIGNRLLALFDEAIDARGVRL